MASQLKRKRGPVEVTDTPKRAKSETVSEENKPNPLLPPSGWDAAFNPPPNIKELIQTNGTHEEEANEPKEESPEAQDFDDFTEQGREILRKRKEALREEHRLRKEVLRQKAATWTISEPIGGRMLNVDPVFTADEEFLILANNTTINVYSTSTSLLTRAIKPEIDSRARPTARIITYCLSPTSPNLLWVACSDGAIYCIDWTSGAGADQYWGISSTGCIHMTVASMKSAGRRRDVVFTTEPRKDGGWRITANELAPPNGPIQTAARTIYSSPKRIHFLKTANGGAVMVAAAENRVIVGALRSTEYDTVDKIKYEFRIFESADIIFSLDVKVSARSGAELKGKKAEEKRKISPIVDVVVGDVKGAIFLHSDLWANLTNSQNNAPGISLVPRKLHWHRQAVHTVKWSKDGNYIISGGTETVLVLWQLDTGKTQFLPHMASTIQNVVISPSGTSYGVQLADNSTMVLSVAELQPTTNIAGIQSGVLSYEELINSVRRVGDDPLDINLVQRTPAILSPTDPSKLLLGVGQMQEINHAKPIITSIPFLQTFDLATGHNVSRQALTRTNITGINQAPNAHGVAEPRVTHMQLSFDGTWLATVEEWTPPRHDLEFLGHQGIDLEEERRNRREVYLKFWQWSGEHKTWELVSRINDPHSFEDSTGAPRILGLASDPTSLRFSTIGEDGIVRTWTARTRKRDGVIVRAQDITPLRNWSCAHAITLSKSTPENLNKHIPSGALSFSEDGSLLAAASGSTNGLLHLLDPELGTIRQTRTRMYDGPIIAISFLGQDLITLSNRIQIYDLILDDLRYSLKFQNRVTSLSIPQKQEMMHLATDPVSRTFAVSVPGSVGEFNFANDPKRKSLDIFFSEVAVFSQEKREPVLQEAFSCIVTALIGAGEGSYLVIDSQAEIRTLLKKGKQAVTSGAQSTTALKLDEPESLDVAAEIGEDQEEDEEEEEPFIRVKSEEESDEDDDDEHPVITQQQLTQIFDIGPSFAMPPMEELFFQVANLVSGPPLPVRVKT